MANNKPLPSIPLPSSGETGPTEIATPSMSILSTEARPHRARLLRYVFDDIQEKGIQGHEEEWVSAFEEGLDNLGAVIKREGWLSALRHGRATAVEEPTKDVGDVRLILDQLRQAAASKHGRSQGGHLVLCLDSYGYSRTIPAEDSGFDIIPSTIGCAFVPGTYSLHNETKVLYGLSKWQEGSRIIGGTFRLKGVTSTGEHNVLSRALRVAVYIQLSLILEQSLLEALHVPLKYTKPRRTTSLLPPPRTASPTPIRSSLLPAKLMGLFSHHSLRRLTRSHSVVTPPRSPVEESRPSFDGAKFIKRLSMLGGVMKPPSEELGELPFAAALDNVEKGSACLSTSPGVVIHPPRLLAHLADKEKQDPNRRLKGDEKVGLSSLLGWEGREARGKGMSGITGFVRQQEISILCTEHAPPTDATASTFRLCGKPQWITYRFFSRNPREDRTVGQGLQELIENGALPCERSECRWTRGQHEIRLFHGDVRIAIRVDHDHSEGETTSIQSWLSCSTCGASTSKVPLPDGAWLFSFGKFLELMIYSPLASNIAENMCEHVVPSKVPALQKRFSLVRHFSTSQGAVSFSLTKNQDVFELRVPRLQIRTSAFEKVTKEATVDSNYDNLLEEEKRILRNEIRAWWEAAADHLDTLEDFVVGSTESELLQRKSLPRLPSADDEYTFEANFVTAPVPSPLPPTPHPPNFETSYFLKRHVLEGPDATAESEALDPSPAVSTESQQSEDTVTSAALPADPGPSVPPKDDSVWKLVELRQKLQTLEQNLYMQLANTPVSHLNDVRRAFQYSAKGTQKRLLAWQKKHLGSKATLVQPLDAEEPDWWKEGCHAVPGADVIVHEEDWGSIIAFTLSTEDYRKELHNLAFNRPPTVTASPPVTKFPPYSTGNASSFFSVPSTYKFFSTTAQPDPDQDDAAWSEEETFSSVITRKEHIRDPASILSIRGVLQKAAAPTDASTLASVSPAGTTATRAKADVSVNTQTAGGHIFSSAENRSVERLLHDLEQSQPPTRPASVLGSRVNSSINLGAKFSPRLQNLTSTSVTSLIPESAVESDATIGQATAAAAEAAANPASSILSPLSQFSAALVSAPLEREASESPPQVPDKDDAPPTVPPKSEHELAVSTPAAPPSSFASTIASGLGSAIRYVINSADISRPNTLPHKPHGLLGGISEEIDDRPHIKYDWTIGKRLKFSCTVYYAKQFDSLRRRCGISDSFVKSVSRSMNWAADGGKSKSNFWKTSDEQFIIKTLVNAWNVADLQVLIDLGPSYFRYLDSTENHATALAKLLGFFTIEVRNLETGAVQSKVDLLVMENLFYDQQISKTFDLKGIQGRKVKLNSKDKEKDKDRSGGGGTTKTLFDGEWIEDQQRTLVLVHPHSKVVLREAIRNDAEFLAKSNIMDYSLLVGIDESKRQIACGLVDTIGSYTFAKTLEYKAKFGLQSGNGKEVTVIPPADYQERFVHALEGYFVACPDKWSKPVDDFKVVSDPAFLPSVL